MLLEENIKRTISLKSMIQSIYKLTSYIQSKLKAVGLIIHRAIHLWHLSSFYGSEQEPVPDSEESTHTTWCCPTLPASATRVFVTKTTAETSAFFAARDGQKIEENPGHILQKLSSRQNSTLTAILPYCRTDKHANTFPFMARDLNSTFSSAPQLRSIFCRFYKTFSLCATREWTSQQTL